VGLVANIADVLDALLERGILPDIVTTNHGSTRSGGPCRAA